MKFKLTMLAVAAAFSAGLTQAEVAIDGSFDGGVSYNKLGDAKAGRVEYDATIGVSGSDKLDAGGNVIWRLEQGVTNYSNGVERNWGGKEAYIGLTDEKLGTVRFGKMKTPFYQTLDDRYGDTGAKFLISEYGRGENFRPSNYIRYDMPTFGGFSASGGYDASAGNSGHYGFDLAAHYKLAGFFADAAYQKRKGVIGTGDADVGNVAQYDGYNWFALAGYNFDNGFGVNGGYKRSEFTPAGLSKVDQHLAFGQGSYKSGKQGVYLTYMQLGNLAGASDTGAKAVAARYDYSLSKRTLGYVEGRYVKNDNNATYTALDSTLGDSNNVYTGNAGEKAYRLTVGMKTYF
ncbi:porin [Andreprevotia chitinilytica]|uniref:porin n=1 Tax=Andreprevotia chitinilytica TaxID=396808 RepID=UPI00055047D2|nr:porin [Andreprevotia chitinilytica]